MRTFARHLAGVVMAGIGGWITSLLIGAGMGPDDVEAALTAIETIIMVVAMLLFYAFTEKGLKFVKRLFPGEWAEEIWKEHAGEAVDSLTKSTAESKIRQGQV